jgi:hypothetical protein
MKSSRSNMSVVVTLTRRGFFVESLHPQRMQRSQVLLRKLDEVAFTVAPAVARQAATKVKASAIDLDKLLPALFATLCRHYIVSGHSPPCWRKHRVF